VHKEALTEVPGAVEDRKDLKFEVFGMSGYAEAIFFLSGGAGASNKAPRTDDLYIMQDPVAGAGAGASAWGSGVSTTGPGFGQPPLPPRGNNAMYGGYQSAPPMGGGTKSMGAGAFGRSASPASAAPPPPPPGPPPPSSFIHATQAAPTVVSAATSAPLHSELVAVAGVAASRRGVSNLPAWLVAQQAEGGGAHHLGRGATAAGAAAVEEGQELEAHQEQVVEDFIDHVLDKAPTASCPPQGAGSREQAPPPPPPPLPATVSPAPVDALRQAMDKSKPVVLSNSAPASGPASVPAKLVFLWVDDEYSMEERRAQQMGLLFLA